MKKTVLHTTGLEIGYTKKKQKEIIAKQVEISLQKGTLVGLIGKNGAGKSTLINTLLGNLKPLSGSIFLHKLDLINYKPLQLAQNISIVLTEKLTPSNLTVYELVALGRQPYTNWIGKLSEIDKLKIQEAIDLTKIAPLLHKKHYEISDGQLQKVLIARALAQDTELIILDEPSTHLDIPNKIALFTLLKKLTQEHNKSILFSTHDIEMAIQFCDNLLVMNNNTVTQIPTDNLTESDCLQTIFADDGVLFDTSTFTFFKKS